MLEYQIFLYKSTLIQAFLLYTPTCFHSFLMTALLHTDSQTQPRLNVMGGDREQDKGQRCAAPAACSSPRGAEVECLVLIFCLI